MDGMGHALFAARVCSRPRQIEIKSVDNHHEIQNANEIKILRVRILTLENQLNTLIHKLYPPSIIPITPEPAPTRRPSVHEIMKVVCKFFHIPKNEMVSIRRDKITVMVRDIAIYQCKMWTSKSYPEIGALFGGRDHTTIMHAYRKLERNRLLDMTLNGQLNEIHSQITALVTDSPKSVNNEPLPPVRGGVTGSPSVAAPEKLK